MDIVKNNVTSRLAESLLTEIIHHMKNEEYNLVLEALAELIKNEVYNAEAMYAGAYSYFMLGDYERAVYWIDNTLSYEPKHLQARVLLARLCLLEDRVDDAMALYEYVLEHGGDALEESIVEEIVSVGEGYAGQKAGRIDVAYPEIAKLIGCVDKSDILKINDNKGKNNDIQRVDDDVTKLCDKVLTESQSLAHKLKMLNTYASEFYLNGRLHDAELLLLAALKIDNASEITLRNMAMVQIGLGCKEKAKKIVI